MVPQLEILKDYFAEALLFIMFSLLLWGKIMTKATHDKIVSAKNDQIDASKIYYEGRIADILAAHQERGADLRHIAETQSRALQTSVDNVQKLVQLVDEGQELARTATPALVARRQVEEGNLNG
jgi:hypothetical protein